MLRLHPYMITENTFAFYSKEDIAPFLKQRAGEKKVGDKIELLPDGSWEKLAESSAKFALFCIPEDIGVRGNLGAGGAYGSRIPFLKAFLNVQSNRFFSGAETVLLGSFDFSKLLSEAENADPETLREMTSAMDKSVSTLVRKIRSAGKIPVAVGGGHNNAYGMIRGCCEASGKPMNVVNCDPHSDFRSMEGRHSGNGFRYAAEEGFLEKYAVIGLHEGYNSEDNLRALDDFGKRVHYSFFEDIFIRNSNSGAFQNAMNNAIKHTGNEYGIELDLDSVAFAPVSALTPSGLSLEQAREYVHYFASNGSPKYFHVCEAAPGNMNHPESLIGKTLSYLVVDFMKGLRSNAQ